MVSSSQSKNIPSFSDDNVQSLIDKAVSEAVAKAVSNVSVPKEENSTNQLVSILAKQFNKMELASNGQQYVDPVIIEQRNIAFEKMKDLLARNKEKGLRGTYQIIGEMFSGEAYINPNQYGSDGKPKKIFIKWDGIPNSVMSPVDEIAREVYDLFKTASGQLEDPVPKNLVIIDHNGNVIYKKQKDYYDAALEDKVASGLEIIKVDEEDLIEDSRFFMGRSIIESDNKPQIR